MKNLQRPIEYANACFDNACRLAQYLQQVENRPYSIICGSNNLGIHYICANINSDGSINEFSIHDFDNPISEIHRIIPLQDAQRIRNSLMRQGQSEIREGSDGRNRLCSLAPDLEFINNYQIN